jgi:DNA polymerase III epsilon subunit-like protein
MQRPTYVFDIETAPLPEEEIIAIMPAFNPDEVKIGNRKPETASAYIEEKRIEHKARFMERAALSALTGKVVAIGVKLGPGEKDYLISTNEERTLIETFFHTFEKGQIEMTRWIGFNISGFDIPFLLRRAWTLGIRPPAGLVKGRYLTSWFVDLVDVWRASSREPEHITLDRLARFLGLGAKTGTGAAFAALLYENHEAAVEYLANDITLTWRIAERLGVILPAGAIEEEDRIPGVGLAAEMQDKRAEPELVRVEPEPINFW